MRGLREIRTTTVVVLMTAACALWTAGPASASSGDTYIWTGNGGDASWATAGNWHCGSNSCPPGGTPLSDQGSDVVFPAMPSSGLYTTSLGQNVEVNTLVIFSSSYSVAGAGQALTVDSSSTLDGAITVDSATFTGVVGLDGPTTLTAPNNAVFQSTVDAQSGTGPPTLTVDGNAVFQAAVGGSHPPPHPARRSSSRHNAAQGSAPAVGRPT